MFWAFIGTLYLIYLTWEDYRHHMIIDDRKNYFMMGMSFGLIGFMKRHWWYILLILAIVLLLGFFLTKFKVLGTGDIHTFMWIYYGFALLSFNSLLIFIIIFIILLLLFEGIKRLLFREYQKMPFYAVILLSFIISCLLLGLYTISLSSYL